MAGIAAIVVSLVFVGLEIRQSAAATRGATQQALADSAREASGALVRDQTTGELTLRFLNATDWSKFTEAERFQTVIQFTTMLRVYESAHYQWTEGNLAPAIWSGWEASLEGVARTPGIGKYWEERRHYFDERFQSFFEGQMKGNSDSPYIQTPEQGTFQGQ